jgi:hypothetical protein
MNISAKIYNQNDLIYELKESNNQIETEEFIREFFISKNPQNTINQLIQNKYINSLSIESKLYALLTEVSMQVKQPFLQDFVNQMKNYPIKAFKMHEEGRVPVAVFNLSAKAQGIENIWQASESLQKYTELFNAEPVKTLQHLHDSIESLSQSQWLGIKQSMQYINIEKQRTIVKYFLHNPENIIGLDKFVSHYALFTLDKELTDIAIQTLNNKNKEYLLRKLSQVFPQGFVIEQLLKEAKGKSKGAFALTLLKPYAQNNKQVQAFLIDALADKHLSLHAAFALVSDNNAVILDKLELVYVKSQSKQQKHSIKLALKISQSSQSEVILQRIKVYDHSLLEKHGSAQ